MSKQFGTSKRLLELLDEKGLTSKRVEEQMLQTGLLADLFEAAKIGDLKAVDRELFRQTVGLPPLNPPLLDWLGTVAISATTERFAVDDHFKLKEDGGVCSYLGGNFKKWFGGEVEEPLGAYTLRFAKLSRPSVDKPIIAELGGEAKAETALVEIFGLIKKQAEGQEGVLLTNGEDNIFYVGKNGVLRAVHVLWFDDGWYVDAYSVEDPNRWDDGHQVFSRN